MDTSAEQLLREGRLDDAVANLQDQIRGDAADPKLRVFLFQLLSVQGQWKRALNQLNVAAEMDPAALAMAQMYREALKCEVLRAEIFAGQRSPLLFGEPPEWVGWLLESLRHTASQQYEAASRLRNQAFEAAPAVPGTIDDRPFDWLADADSRLGPVLEAVVNGRYYWIPTQNIRQIDIEEPTDLRDLVWAPVQFTWSNGGQVVGVIPVRYPGSEQSDDELVRLARKTVWCEEAADTFLGLGQRVLATSEGEHSLLEVRKVTLETGD